MPLNNAYLPKVDGLQTEASPISSDPRSLADCVDIISDVEDSIEARHGHPSVYFQNVYGPFSSNQNPIDLYAYRNETEKVFVCLYKGTDNIYRYRQVLTSTEEIDENSNYEAISIIDNKSITRLSPVNSKPTAFAHDERLLFLTDYGVFYTSYSNYAQTPEKVDFPIIRSTSVQSKWLPADSSFTDAEQENRHWLVPGFQVNVKVVVEIEAKQSEKGERVLLSPPSKIYEVKNFNLYNIDNSKRTSNTLVKVNTVNLSHEPQNSKYKVKFFRTPQFPIGEPPITEYFYAGEEKAAEISYAGEVSPVIAINKQNMIGMTIDPTGTYLYVADDPVSSTDSITKLEMTTPFDITTASIVGTSNVDRFRNSNSASAKSLCFDVTGNYRFWLGRVGLGTEVYVFRNDLSSQPWNPDTIFLPDKQINIAALAGVPNGVKFPTGLVVSSDGTKFFVCGGISGSYEPICIMQFSMSTPFDVSTATFDKFSPLTGLNNPKGMQFTSNGDYILILGSNNILYVFETARPWDISDIRISYTKSIASTTPPNSFSSVLLTPDDKYIYVTDNTTQKVVQFNVNDISGGLYLTANDDVITTLEHLYNDPTQGGFSVTNHQPIPAKNVTEFLNYYIYSCITPPTISQFGLKQLPKDGETLTLRLTGAAGVIPKEKTITFKNSPSYDPSEVKIAANATSLTSNYLATEDDLTFTGLRATQALDTTIRIVPGTGQGQVEAYGRITSYVGVLPSGSSAIVRVVPSTEGFDINRFNQPGVAAIVNESGQIVLLFSYSNYRRVSASTGFIDFEGGVSVGGISMPGTTPVIGTFYMYALNVENLETQLATSAGVNTTTSNLSVYYGDGSSYLSLLPCKNSLPFPVASPSPVTTTVGATALFAVSSGDYKVNPFYTGLLNKPQGKLLDDMAIGIADAFQNIVNDSNSATISCIGGESRENGVVNVEILDPTYEIIEFSRGASSTDIYEPVIETTNTEFARSEEDKGAFVISKQNNPELIPYGGTSDIAGPYVTTKVGNPDKAIVACASTKDSVYFLKEDGIARLSLVPGALVPLVDSIFIFDNTTFCVSAGSVQNLQDSIVFLAQDGVYRLSGTSIQKLSMAIEREIKKAISECRSVNKQNDIRSFANDAKGLYGLTIPLTGANYITYVLSINTMKWSKWSNTWKGAVVDQDGRLTTHIGDATDNGLRQDKYTSGNPVNPVDQIDDNISLNGFSATDTGNVRSFDESNLGLACNRLGSKQVYYRQNDGTLTKVTVQVVDSDNVNITFPSAPPTFNNGDSLVVGVNVSLTFNPFTNGNPSDLKMFSGFHIHTVENVKDLKCSFRTEARNTFSTVTSFSVSPTDRNVFKCNIPLEAVRGRYLYRKIDHVRPFEIFTMPAQAIVFRDTGSTRVNKENG